MYIYIDRYQQAYRGGIVNHGYELRLLVQRLPSFISVQPENILSKTLLVFLFQSPKECYQCQKNTFMLGSTRSREQEYSSMKIIL